MPRRHGLSLVELMMALVVLGIISAIYLQTTRYANRNSARSRDWILESAANEKTVENLRVDYTVPALQTLSYEVIDSSGGIPIRVTVRGERPPSSVASGVPTELLAQMTVSARRQGDASADSLEIVTLIWVN